MHAVAWSSFAAAAAVSAQAPPALAVCATTPDLGSLLREIGGPSVDVTVLVKAVEDPHFLEARPNLIRALHGAELLVEVGLGLEDGWLPVLVHEARNRAIQPGAPGRLDASSAIRPLAVATGRVDRAQGDVHAAGNPHYLLDPVRALAVAARIRDVLGELKPDRRDEFGAHYAAFRARLAERIVGPELARIYDVEKLATLQEHGRLLAFLREQEQLDRLGGWLGAMRRHDGAAVVADHDLWPYFAARFGIRPIGFFEPKPGIAPTSSHLQELIGRMRQQNARVVLGVPYFSSRHAEFVAQKSGAKIAAMAHQVGARPGTGDYVAMIDHNLRAILHALEAP